MPKKSSAKKKRKNSTLRQYLNRVAIVGGLLIFSLFFLGGLSIYKTLTKPFASADSSSSFDIKSSEIVTLALITVDSLNADYVKTNSIDMVFFDTSKNKVVVFNIPLDLEIDVFGKFGPEKYEKIVSLGMMENNDLQEGAELLRNTLESQFAFNVDRYLVVEEGYSADVINSLEFGKSGGLMSFETLSGISFSSLSDATPGEIYYLYTFVNSLPSDRFIHHESSAEFYEGNSYIDTIIRDLTFDSAVAIEQASLAVLNGTNIPGIASFGARIMENAGAHVISVANAKDTYHESVLVVEDKEAALVKEIQKYFNIEQVIEKRAFDNLESIADRADVTLIIGFDIANTL